MTNGTQNVEVLNLLLSPTRVFSARARRGVRNTYAPIAMPLFDMQHDYFQKKIFCPFDPSRG